MKSDKVLEILQTLGEFATELERLAQLPKEEAIRDTMVQWAIRYGLQSAIQCVLDIGLHLLVESKLDRPRDSEDVLLALGRHGIVPAPMAERIQGMAGFRNILVHRYVKVDPERVHQHLQHDLADFAEFAIHVRRWLAAAD